MPGFSQVARTLISDLKSFGVKISTTKTAFRSSSLRDQNVEVETIFSLIALLFLDCFYF